LRQDKGHRAEWQEFARAIRNGGPAPISFEEICATALATIRIVDSLRSGQQERVIATEPQAAAAPLVS
jgi:predicted dehydrogenase